MSLDYEVDDIGDLYGLSILPVCGIVYIVWTMNQADQNHYCVNFH